MVYNHYTQDSAYKLCGIMNRQAVSSETVMIAQAKAVGSRPLGKRIEKLQPLLHVFGGSNFPLRLFLLKRTIHGHVVQTFLINVVQQIHEKSHAIVLLIAPLSRMSVCLQVILILLGMHTHMVYVVCR